MRSPLFWSTRPSHQNTSWQQQLSALGETVALPLLEIVPISSNEAQQAVKSLVLDLDQFEHVLFVSQNAVAHAFDWFDRYWPQMPAGIRFYAVGSIKVVSCLFMVDGNAKIKFCSVSPLNNGIIWCRSCGSVAHWLAASLGSARW